MKKLFKLWLVATMGVFGLTGLTFALIGGPRADEPQTPVIVAASDAEGAAFIGTLTKYKVEEDGDDYYPFVFLGTEEPACMYEFSQKDNFNQAELELISSEAQTKAQPLYVYKFSNFDSIKKEDGTKPTKKIESLASTISFTVNDKPYTLDEKYMREDDWKHAFVFINDTAFGFAPLSLYKWLKVYYLGFNEDNSPRTEDTTMNVVVKVAFYFGTAGTKADSVTEVSIPVTVKYEVGATTYTAAKYEDKVEMGKAMVDASAWNPIETAEYWFDETEAANVIFAVELGGGLVLDNGQEEVEFGGIELLNARFGMGPQANAHAVAYVNNDTVTEELIYDNMNGIVMWSPVYYAAMFSDDETDAHTKVNWKDDSTYTFSLVIMGIDRKAEDTLLNKEKVKMHFEAKAFKVKERHYPKVSVKGLTSVHEVDPLHAQLDSATGTKPEIEIILGANTAGVQRGYDKDYVVAVAWAIDTLKPAQEIPYKVVTDASPIKFKFDTLADGFYTVYVALYKPATESEAETIVIDDVEAPIFVGDTTVFCFGMRIGNIPRALLPDTVLSAFYGEQEILGGVKVGEKNPTFTFATKDEKNNQTIDLSTHQIALAFGKGKVVPATAAGYTDTVYATQDDEGVWSATIPDGKLKHGDTVQALAYYAKDKEMIKEAVDDGRSSHQFMFYVDTVKKLAFRVTEVVYTETGNSVMVDSATPILHFELFNCPVTFGADSGKAVMHVGMETRTGGYKFQNVTANTFKIPADWGMAAGYTYKFTFELYKQLKEDTGTAPNRRAKFFADPWDHNDATLTQEVYVTVKGTATPNLKVPTDVKATWVAVRGGDTGIKIEWKTAGKDQDYNVSVACGNCTGAAALPRDFFVYGEACKNVGDTVTSFVYWPMGDDALVGGNYYVSMRGVNLVGSVANDDLRIGLSATDTTVWVLANYAGKDQFGLDSSDYVVVPDMEDIVAEPTILIVTDGISGSVADPDSIPANRTFTVVVNDIVLSDSTALIKVEWGAVEAGAKVNTFVTTNKSFTIPADSVLKEGKVYFIEFTLVMASDSVTAVTGSEGAISDAAYFYVGKKRADLLNPKVFYVGATSFRTSKPIFEFAVRDTSLNDSVRIVVMRGQDTSSVFGVNKFVWKHDTIKTTRYTVAEDMADGDYMLWAYLLYGKKAPFTVISDTMKVEGGISIATNTILTVAVAGSDRTFGPDSTAVFNHAKPSFKLTLDGAKFGEAWVAVKYGMTEDDMDSVVIKTADPVNYDACVNAEDSAAAVADYALYGGYDATFTVAEALEDGDYTIGFYVLDAATGKIDETAQHVYPCSFTIATVRPQVTVVPFNGDIAVGGGDEVEYKYPDSVNISGEFEFDYSELTLLVQVQGVQVGEVEGAPEFHAIGPNEDEDGNVIPGEPDLDGGFFPDLGFGGMGEDQFFVDGEGRPFEVSVHATLTKGTDTLEVELTPAAFGEGLFQLTADELYTAIERGWNEEMPGIGTWKVAYTVNYDSLPCLVKNLTLYGKIERDSLTSIYVQGFAKGEQQAHLARGFEDTVKMNIVPMNVDGVIGTNYAINLKVMNPQNWQKPEVIDTIIKTNVINPFKFVVPDGYYTFSVTLLEPATGNQWEIMKDQDDQDIVFNSCFRMGLHCPDIENGEAGVLVDGYDATFVWAGVEGQYYEIIVAGDTAIVRADERIMNEEGMYTTGTATMEVGTYNFKIRGVKLAASFDNIMYIEIDSALMIVKATDWAEGEFAVETIVPYAKPEGARVSETYAQTTIAPSMMFEGVIDTTYNYGALFRWDESESNVEIEIYDTLGNLKDRLFSWGPEAREYLWNTKNPADSGKWFMWRIRTVDAEGEYDEEAEKTIYTVKEYNASEWDTVGRFQLVNWRNPNELVLNSAALMVYFGEEGIDYCEDCDLQTVRGGKRPTFSYIVSDVENELGEGSGIYFSIEDEDGDGEAIEEKTIRPIQTEGTITVGKDLVKNYGYIVNVWLVNANGDYYRGYYTGAMFTYVVEDEAFVEMPELKGVNVYPNPAAGQFNVTVPANGNVTIFNANGQVIARENNVEGVRSYNLRNSGIYFVRVIANGQAAVKRVVIR